MVEYVRSNCTHELIYYIQIMVKSRAMCRNPYIKHINNKVSSLNVASGSIDVNKSELVWTEGVKDDDSDSETHWLLLSFG